MGGEDEAACVGVSRSALHETGKESTDRDVGRERETGEVLRQNKVKGK